MLRLAVMSCMIAWSGALSADDWPQFRGPNCTGLSETRDSLPVAFSAQENLAWSVAVGDGIGSPTIVAGRVFVSGMLDEQTVALFAIDLRDGSVIWKRTWNVGVLPEVHATNSHASTTPAATAERVFFYFSSLGMLALDARSGKDLWQRELPVPYFVFKWGPGMSPVLYQENVLFCQDDDLNPALYSINAENGEVLWKDERYDMAVNYSHPVICNTPAGDEIIVAGTGLLIGYDPQTGHRKWYAKSLLRNIKTTPVSLDGVVYVSLQSGGIANQWLVSADQAETGNSDGRLTKAEIQGIAGEVEVPNVFYERTFDRGDVNKDGFLEGRELDRAFLHPGNFAGASYDAENPADECIQAVRSGGVGDVTQSHLLWKHTTKHTDHIVSPLVHDQRMLLITGGGITTSFDVKDGRPLRGPKRIPNASEYFASPVVGDDKIYICGANGTVIVLQADGEQNVLGKNDLGESIMATPAISGANIVFRTRSRLLCVRNQ